MEEAILNFANQFSWEPTIVNKNKLVPTDKFTVCGMGGSHLAAGLLKIDNPNLDLLIHRDYGLPRVPDYFLRQGLLIISSYSGNTEETLDFAEQALAEKYALAIISKGGKLIAFARKNNLPHIILPEVRFADGQVDLPPRMATGFVMTALLRLMGKEKKIGELKTANFFTAPDKKIADEIGGRIPLFYASEQNGAIANYWKIIINETSKRPAFANVFPELNHNEMASFASGNHIKDFIFIFLKDEDDNPRITKRMAVTKQTLSELGGNISEINLIGGNRWEKIINSAIAAHWTAYYIARAKNLEPLATPMIEKFKKLIANH